MEQHILVETYIEGLYLLEDMYYMEEDLKDVLSKLTQPVLKRIMPQMFKVAASKDPKEFDKLMGKFGIKKKTYKEADLIDLVKTLPQDIQEGADYAKKVIENSIPKASRRHKLGASYFVAVMAKLKNPNVSNLMGPIKSELKNFIPKVRSFYEEVEEKAVEAGKRISPEDLADVAIGIGSVVAIAALAGMAVYGAWVLLGVLLSVATFLAWSVGIAAILSLLGGLYWLGSNA